MIVGLYRLTSSQIASLARLRTHKLYNQKLYGTSRYRLNIQAHPCDNQGMNIVSVSKGFPDQHACIAQLERVRFDEEPYCPLCGSVKVARKAENDVVGRWNCHGCKSSFNVLSGTVMQKTKIPLQKWFLAISLAVTAKESLSSHQLAPDLELNQKSAWYLMRRVRAAMAAEESALGDQGSFLRGIVEADETYIGGKPRKRNRRGGRKPAKRGRGSSKTAVLAAVERGGKVKAMVADDLTGRGILQFIQDSVDP